MARENPDKQKQSELTNSMLGRMIRLLYSAFFTSSKGSQAIEASKEDDSAGILLAREAIGEMLVEIMRKDAVDPAVREFAKLRESVEVVTARLNDILTNNARTIIDLLLPQGALRGRLLTDHAREKCDVASYVAATFFGRQAAFCFVQASTTAIHLAEALSKRNLPTGSLFYTNSIAFPLVMLRENSRVSVYTFCGPQYDSLCGAWLFSSSERETIDTLRALFTRSRDPLTTVFLTPIAATIEDGIFFMKNETALLASILMEEAKHIVIMTLGSRLYRGRGELTPQPHAWCPGTLGGWKELKDKRVSLVIAGDRVERELIDFGQQFVAHGIEVHLQRPGSDNWQVLQKAKNG